MVDLSTTFGIVRNLLRDNLVNGSIGRLKQREQTRNILLLYIIEDSIEGKMFIPCVKTIHNAI